MKKELTMTHFRAETFNISSLMNLQPGRDMLAHIEIKSGGRTFFLTVTVHAIRMLAKFLQDYEPQMVVTLKTTQGLSYDIEWNSFDTVFIKIKDQHRVIELSRTLAQEMASLINTATFDAV